MNDDLLKSLESINKSALESVQRLSEIQFKVMSRLTEQQIEASSDYMDQGLQHLKEIGDVEDIPSASQAQSEYLTELNDNLMDHAKKTIDILAEAKSELSSWVEKGVEEASKHSPKK